MWTKFVLIFCALIVVCYCAKMPKFFNICRWTDEDLGACIAKSGNAALPHIVDGVSQIHIPSLKPLKVNHMTLNVGNLNLNITDAEIYGLDNLHIDNVIPDKDKMKLTYFISVPKMMTLGNYNISGAILILPISGNGPINATFVNMKIKYGFDFKIQERKNKRFMYPLNSKYVYETDRAYFQLKNLFRGNELLGKQMNKFLDENWQEVNQEIGVKLGDVIGEILTEIVRGFMSRVTFDEIFSQDT